MRNYGIYLYIENIEVMSISFTDLIILLEILNTSVGIHSRDKQILKNKQYQTFPKSNRKIVGTTDIISYIYNVKVLVFGSIGNICVFSAVKRKTKNPSYCRNSSKTHHTVGTVQKPITLSEQFKNLIEKSKKGAKSIPFNTQIHYRSLSRSGKTLQ